LIHFYSNDNEDEELVEGYDETIDHSGKFVTISLPSPRLASSTPPSNSFSSSLSRKVMELLPQLDTLPSPPVIFLDDLCGIELGFEDNGMSFVSILHSYLSAGKVPRPSSSSPADFFFLVRSTLSLL
jgi:hypothetical protein